MKRLPLCCIASLLMIGAADGAEKLAEAAPPKPLKADYVMYSGELGDMWAPTKADRKMTIHVTGPAAKEMFDALYPDLKTTCSSERGERLRAKKDLFCAFSPSGGYQCFIGFDLRTGESIGGGIC